jgi:hypothetical protein
MKKALQFGCMLAGLFSVSAFGEHKLNIGARVDLESKDQEFNKTGKASNSSFKFTHIRFNWKGDLPVDGMTYNFRWRADKADNYDKDEYGDSNSLASTIEYAYVTKKWDNGLSLSLGRQFIVLGGREDDYSGMEVYTYSQFADNYYLAYRNALTIGYNTMDQSFGLMIINPNRAQKEDSNRKFAYNLHWYGNLMDGMIKPIVAYSVEPADASDVKGTDKNAEVTSLGLGAQINVNQMMVELDYYTGTKEKQAGTDQAPKDIDSTAIVANIKYNHGDYAPFVKYIMEEEEKGNLKSEITSFDIGLEYSLGSGNRIHAVYSSQDFDYAANDTNNTDYTATTIRFGFRANVDIF